MLTPEPRRGGEQWEGLEGGEFEQDLGGERGDMTRESKKGETDKDKDVDLKGRQS